MRNEAGQELLAEGHTGGLFLREVGKQPKRFSTVRSVGDATSAFSIKNSNEKLRVKISGTQRYLKIHFNRSAASRTREKNFTTTCTLNRSG